MYNEEEESSAGSSNLIPALLRYKWHLVFAIVPLLILAVAVIVSLPPIFRSEGIVLVETQQIPTDLVKSTVTSQASERIQIIHTRVMTREKLLGIIDKYDYFQLDDDDPGSLETTDIVDAVRNSITIDLVKSTAGRRAQETAIAFSVGFDSESPHIAQAVANDLVNLFLSENIKARTERASETTQFLLTEAEKVKEQLDKTEAAVAEYKQQNKDSLPEHLSLYVDMRERLRRQLDETRRDIRATSEQINFLKNQMALNSSTRIGESGSQDTRLESLRARYAELSLLYKPSYPDLIALRDQIQMLERFGGGDSAETAQVYSGAGVGIASQLAALEADAQTYKRDESETETKLADIERRILQIPLIERGLISLNRDYKTKLDQYNSIRAKAMDASMAESLEQGRKAERFSIVEAPAYPIKPNAPDRVKLLIIGSGISFGFPIGLVLLVGFFDRTIRRIDVLDAEFGESITVMEVPHFVSEREAMSSRKKIKITLAFLIVLSLLGLLVIHFMYMPLGVLVSKVLMRFGFY